MNTIRRLGPPRVLLQLVAAAATVVVASAWSCSTATEDCICTQEFRAFSLAVYDEAGAPVDGVTLQVRNLRTNRLLTSTFLGLLPSGHYWIADDGMIDEFSVAGDSVRVTGSKDGQSFETGLRFGVDPCRCHVEKRGGPESVVIR